MRQSLLRSLAMVLVALAAGPTLAQQPGDEVAFTTLAMDVSSSMAGARDEVIVDENRLRQVWAEVYRRESDPPPIPQVDFNHRMVVVVSMGQQPTSNAAIVIKRVSLVRGQADGYPLLVIHSTETRPGRRCFVLPSASGPIHIIELPFYPDVTFQRTRKTTSCR